MKTILLIVLFWTMGCQTTAPSSYELNRRSGVAVSLDDTETSPDEQIESDLSKFRTGSDLPKVMNRPVRLPGVVEPVFYFGGQLNGKHWMQNTWLYVEVDSERWLGELDHSSGEWFERKMETKGGKK